MIESHADIHAVYCKLADRDLPMSMSAHFVWSAWKARGWGEEDLSLVVAHIKDLIRKGRRYPESLRFSNLIGNLERFAEDLAEARALARKPRYAPGKAAVLRATKRPDEPEQAPAQSAAQILAGNEALKKLLECRDNL